MQFITSGSYHRKPWNRILIILIFMRVKLSEAGGLNGLHGLEPGEEVPAGGTVHVVLDQELPDTVQRAG